MTHKDDSHGRRQSPDHERTRQKLFRDTPASAKELAEQQARLERLRSFMDEARTLREREVELEVECIEADVFLKSASSTARPNLDTRAVTKIAEAFHRKRTLEWALGIGETAAARAKGAGSDDLERLYTGHAALMSWLEAPRTVRPQQVPRAAQGVFLVVAAVVVWASVVIHPSILLVLVGLALPMAFLRMSGQDLIWVRLGAERKFRATGLKPPGVWQESAVKARVLELDHAIDDLSRQTKGTADTDEIGEEELERREVEFAQAEAHLGTLLTEAGLDADSIDEEFAQWIETVGNARSVRKELEQLKIKRTKIDAEIEHEREAIFKFLSWQGEAPGKGYADLDALAEGIQRLMDRSDRSD